MAVLDLVLVAAWVGLVSLLRGAIHYRRTGASPVRLRDPPGSAQWWARLLSTVGVALAIVAPLAELAGLAPFAPLDQPLVQWGGVALVVLGTAVTVSSQLAMGGSWRADVDPAARSPLVTSGPFRLVRNPVFAGSAITIVGLALVVPNVLSLLMVSAFLAGLEIQVRLVEEPYLLRVHGDAYRDYAARTGRFVPGVGRLRGECRQRPYPR
jgi:protein-S-isoprenylcysteine O-methyltransferase Ste14